MILLEPSWRQAPHQLDVLCYDDMPNVHSTGYDKPGASKDEQADCKVSEVVIFPSAVIYSSGAEAQPDSKNADVKIKNETHGLIIYRDSWRDSCRDQDPRYPSYQRSAWKNPSTIRIS